jgi:hypothetical protein
MTGFGEMAPCSLVGVVKTFLKYVLPPSGLIALMEAVSTSEMSVYFNAA